MVRSFDAVSTSSVRVMRLGADAAGGDIAGTVAEDEALKGELVKWHKYGKY